jgi:hypothetical protein
VTLGGFIDEGQCWGREIQVTQSLMKFSGFMTSDFLSLGRCRYFRASLSMSTSLRKYFGLKKPGKGNGIVLDDLLAGLYTLIVLPLLNWWGLV